MRQPARALVPALRDRGASAAGRRRGAPAGLGLALAGSLLLAATAAAEARVVRFEVLEVESPTFEGRRFGEVGTYEKVVGRATMAVDPSDPRNAVIVDLDRAPRNGAGEVEFTADVTILKPVDLARGNGRLFYDVLNRGRKLGLILMNDAPASNDPTAATDAGNGFLMDRGYTVVWSGWQGDLTEGDGRMLLLVPVIEGVTGTAREEFIFDHATNPVRATLSYPAADTDPARATLTVRQNEADSRATPPDLAFTYLGPTEIEITRSDGFDAGAIYEFIYEARDPKVLGLGFAATRDIVSFLRNDPDPAVGGQHPLAVGDRSAIQRALALGISQSGRFLRDFVYQGFNEDEAGRDVFDGVIPHIAGSRKTFTNERFAQPGRYSRQHEDHLYPGDQFPFTYGVLTDPLTGQTDGILARCRESDTCPKVMHTDTSTEFWQGRASLVVMDTRGEPIELPEDVRAYLMSSAPHFNSADAKPEPTPACTYLTNPLHVGAPMRALVVALDRWVSDGTAPPATRYPSLADGTLVDPERMKFPTIPGLTYAGTLNRVAVVDHGAQPPKVGEAYPVFVPAVDADGHDIAGVRIPAVEAPLFTHLGWNLRREGYAAGALCGLAGSSFPLPPTEEEARATGDSRIAIADRYPTPEAYIEAVTAAAEGLVEAGLMLEADAERAVEAAVQGPLAGGVE